MATAYAKDRIQFGAPIGSFQAVKHRCADMLVDVEGMRSATWYAAWAASTGEPGWEQAASTAKVWCADASKRVMASGLQVHGGIGFTWEHDLHLFIKRAQYSQLDFGDATHHRALLAVGLRGRCWPATTSCDGTPRRTRSEAPVTTPPVEDAPALGQAALPAPSAAALLRRNAGDPDLGVRPAVRFGDRVVTHADTTGNRAGGPISCSADGGPVVPCTSGSCSTTSPSTCSPSAAPPWPVPPWSG